MPRKSWVYTSDGRVIEKDTPEYFEYMYLLDERKPAVFGDEGDFVSPIDGKVYSGKRGMREHNARHDVVNNRDLVGLKVGFSGKVDPPTPRQREEMRREIEIAARRKGYLDGQ